MGGRGASGAKRQSGTAKSNTITVSTKFTQSQINSMSRQQLEAVARAIYIKRNPSLSASEADYRARSLMSGNSDSQLRKYVKKYG